MINNNCNFFPQKIHIFFLFLFLFLLGQIHVHLEKKSNIILSWFKGNSLFVIYILLYCEVYLNVSCLNQFS